MRDPNNPCLFCTPRSVTRRNALAYCARDSFAYRKTYESVERGEYGSTMTFRLLLGAIPILLGLLALVMIILQ